MITCKRIKQRSLTSSQTFLLLFYTARNLLWKSPRTYQNFVKKKRLPFSTSSSTQSEVVKKKISKSIYYEGTRTILNSFFHSFRSRRRAPHWHHVMKNFLFRNGFSSHSIFPILFVHFKYDWFIQIVTPTGNYSIGQTRIGWYMHLYLTLSLISIYRSVIHSREPLRTRVFNWFYYYQWVVFLYMTIDTIY